MSRAVQPITRKRLCANPACDEFFDMPHHGTWPAAFCSSKCHLAINPKAKPKGPRAISPASTSQRAKVAGRGCVVCGESPCHPAHVIDRALGGDDDPRSVVALCPRHHRAYDTGGLSLLEHLEPRYREEIAYAVARVGLLSALQRLTNQRWRPDA